MATSTEHIRNQLARGRLGSYLPVAGWHHFPLVDDDPAALADQTVRSAGANGWDFVKIMPNGNYLPVAYGADYEYSRDPRQWCGTFRSHPIASASDAARLPALDAANPTIAAEIDTARRIVGRMAHAKPVIATLFDPLSWVQELSTPLDPAFALELMRHDAPALERALSAIHQTNRALVEGFVAAGCDGVFMSTKLSQARLLTDAQHDRYVMPYLQETAEWLRGRTWFNVLHVHGIEDLRIDDLLELDYEALNWESTPTVDSATGIAEVRARTGKMIVGGIDRQGDLARSRSEAKSQLARRLEDALRDNAGGPFAFAPGCALPLSLDADLFDLIAEVAADFGLREP